MQLTDTDRDSMQTKRARLANRLGQAGVTGKIPPRNRAEPAPLSFSQEQLWLQVQRNPDNPVYNVAGAVRFDGMLDTGRLLQALNEVTQRHEILSSRVTAPDGQPRQSVMENAALQTGRLDFKHLPAASKMPAFQQAADDFIRQPFRLSEQPPLRVLLAELADDCFVLLLVLHHIAADRWSVGILMQETALIYQAMAQGKANPLPPLPVQYADYCAWQRSRSGEQDSHMAYWTEKLAGVTAVLDLPTDYSRPPVQTFNGEVYRFELSPKMSEQLKALALKHNATLFMVMAAAYAVLLYRYTGNRDFCIGYPVAGRNEPQTAGLIGYFVNTLVLRCRLDGSRSFTSLLAELREQALSDQSHPELALVPLLETLKLPRSAGFAPLFQVMLTVQNAPAAELNLPGVAVSTVQLPVKTSPYDLTLLAEDRQGSLSLALEYNTGLFSCATAKKMAGHLETLLTAVAQQPWLVLARLPLLTGAERWQLIHDWSGTNVNRPEQGLVHQLIEAQAALNPEKAAAVFGGRTLSYQSLNDLAEQWSAKLKACGIGPESRVGVCVERSPEMLVALLAVLKCGAAYIPLDPEYPEERLVFILGDAGAGCLLTESKLADTFADMPLPLLFLDAPDVTVSAPAGNMASVPKPSGLNTAYIIYTSGSTGRPKGVQISHAGLLHSTLARKHYYPETPSCFLLLSSVAFDSSVAGIFWTLSQGGCLCLPTAGELANPVALVQLIQRRQVSHLLALPSLYNAFLDSAGAGQLASLRAVIAAGEACAGEIAAKHRDACPSVNFYNEYGPTEGTVWSTVFHYDGLRPDATLPIGRPIANVQVYILDGQLQPVPAGIPGELCIAGAGLAQGYIRQPGLTAEKFIPNPFADGPERLYRTGDLARFRHDGEIEFLGRIDHQVKIRGYRVELSEIQQRLLQFPGIREAAVLANDTAGTGEKLCAFLVAAENANQDASALQTYLKNVLPGYMVPGSFHWLGQLPRTPNGKLDRQTLLALSEPVHDMEPVKNPANWLEESLAEIWQEVLELEQVGVNVDFFDAGGHSLAAIQVSSRIYKLFNVELPLDILFQSPTIESLASELGRLLVDLHGDEVDELLKETC